MLYEKDENNNLTVLKPKELRVDFVSNISDDVYRELIFPMISKVVALRAEGYTLDGIANFLGITSSQLSACNDKYPEFRSAMARGAELLKASLTTTMYQRGKGYVHATTKTVTEKRGDTIIAQKTEVAEKLVYSDACLFRALEIIDPDNHRKDTSEEMTTEKLVKMVRGLNDDELADFIRKMTEGNA